MFSYATFFSKYAIIDGERVDQLALKAYGDPFFDWVILLTNNMVNAQYDWPMTNFELQKVLEEEFDNAYTEVHHYETIKIGQYAAGLHVDETFYNGQHKVNVNGTVSLKNGSEICGPVTVAEYYTRENEKKREIYLLKPAYFQSFVDDFRKKKSLSKSQANILIKD